MNLPTLAKMREATLTAFDDALETAMHNSRGMTCIAKESEPVFVIVVSGRDAFELGNALVRRVHQLRGGADSLDHTSFDDLPNPSDKWYPSGN